MEDNNEWHTIFLSSNKFYLWGRMNDEVEEFVSQDIREIASLFSQSGLKELARKPLIYSLSGIYDSDHEGKHPNS